MRVVSVSAVAVLSLVMMSGCVSKGAYDDEVEKNEHLRSVKTEQDIERDGLHADVNALHRAYTQQSMRMTTVEGIVTQATTELRGIQSRLTSMNQELTQQRADVGKIAVHASETLQVLRALRDQQLAASSTLTQLTTKVDAIKVASATRAARAGAPHEGKVQKERPEGKTAVERAMDQQMGLGPHVEPAPSGAAVAGSPATAPAPAVTSKSTPVPGSVPAGGGAVTPASAPLSNPAPAVSGSSPVVAGDKGVSPLTFPAGGPALGVPVTESLKPSESMMRVEDELSPLQRSSLEAKPEAKAKQGWGEWAKEKIFGKKPVQTVAKTPPTSESEKK